MAKQDKKLIKHAKDIGFSDEQIEAFGDRLEEHVNRIRPMPVVNEFPNPKPEVEYKEPAGQEHEEEIEIVIKTDPSKFPNRNRILYDDGHIQSKILDFTREKRKQYKVFVARIEKDQNNFREQDRMLTTRAKVTFVLTPVQANPQGN